MVVVGTLLAVTPPLGKRLTDVWMKDKLNRGWALVTAGVGGLIIWAAPASRAAAFIQALGGLTLLKAIYLLVAPKAQLIGLVTWWNQLPPRTYRLWGLLSLALGATILVTL